MREGLDRVQLQGNPGRLWLGIFDTLNMTVLMIRRDFDIASDACWMNISRGTAGRAPPPCLLPALPSALCRPDSGVHRPGWSRLPPFE